MFTIYRHFGDFIKCIFTIFLQIQPENNFLPTSKHRQARVRRFLVFICTTASFIAQILSSKYVLKWDAILALDTKQWIGKDIPSNAQKLLFADLVNSHTLVNTNKFYFFHNKTADSVNNLWNYTHRNAVFDSLRCYYFNLLMF